MRLLPPNGETTAGQVRLGEQDVLSLRGEALRELRGQDIGMIFQDPLTSLNPTFSVRAQLVDAQKAHRQGRQRGERDLRRRAVEMLELVGIPDPSDRIDDYPHQFSGGMRQRIMIAMALLLEPARAHRRRGDVRARRHPGGADPRAAASGCVASKGRPSSSSRTTWASCRRSATASW